MASNKKSFLLHIDSLEILDELSDQEVADLFRAIKAYQNDQPYELDKLTQMVFFPFKNQFIRDDEKYKETCKARAEAGAKGGRQKQANASNSKQVVANAKDDSKRLDLVEDLANLANLANLADNKNKNKNKNKSDSDLKDLSAKANQSFDIFKYWCEVMNKSLTTSKLTPKRDKAIKARLKEGYSIEQIKAAIVGCRNDPFSMGRNDRQKPFNDIELICRTGEKLESFITGLVEKKPMEFSLTTEQNIKNIEDLELD